MTAILQPSQRRVGLFEGTAGFAKGGSLGSLVIVIPLAYKTQKCDGSRKQKVLVADHYSSVCWNIPESPRTPANRTLLYLSQLATDTIHSGYPWETQLLPALLSPPPPDLSRKITSIVCPHLSWRFHLKVDLFPPLLPFSSSYPTTIPCHLFCS